jgi:hypothetical protein
VRKVRDGRRQRERRAKKCNVLLIPEEALLRNSCCLFPLMGLEEDGLAMELLADP